MTNPYISRGPVRNPNVFFGRKHELHEIAAFLRGNQSVSIVGPRKIGKTSLLFHLMRPETWPQLGLDEQNLFVYIDCEVLGDGTHEEIFGILAEEMILCLDERGLPPEPALERASQRPSRLAFEGAIRKLNQRGLRIVLILDEFERLSANANLDVNFFNALRSAAGRYQLVFLTASASPLIALTYSNKSQDILSSPFFNIFAPLFLGLLEQEYAVQLISQPAQAEAVSFTPETINFIYQLVGGHPLALQVACFHAYNQAVSSPEPDHHLIEENTLQELQAHFQYYWRNLSENEQETLTQISSAARRAQGDTTLRQVLRDLLQKCLLLWDGNRYRYPSRAWEEFVTANAPSKSASTGDTSSLSGTMLGVYEVLEKLGRGGMAEVYKGYHPRLDRTVAIKILPAKIALESSFQQRFEREARAVAALKHPHIVQIFDFGDENGLYYMVMEYIAGQDLGQIIKENGLLPPERVIALLRDVAGALDYAHTQGLVHRDVKPSNVMIEAENRAILTDFGIVRLMGSKADMTQSAMIGTLDYMAPEQINAANTVTKQADIYAFGVMAYQLLTGRLPFNGDNMGAVLMAHLQQAPPDPRTINSNLPQSAAQALLKALSKDPAERMASATELVNQLAD